MITVSNEYKRAIYGDARKVLYRIVINDSETYDQTQIKNMTLDESAGRNVSSPVGVAYSSSLNLVIRSPKNQKYENAKVAAEAGIVLQDESVEWIPLGVYYVMNASSDDDFRTVTLNCFDKMSFISGTYNSELSYPTELENVARELASTIETDLAEPDGGFPQMMVRVKPFGISLRDAIGYVAGCIGCNARFNRAGVLEFVRFKDTGEKISRRVQYMGGLKRSSQDDVSVDITLVGKAETYPINILTTESGAIIPSPSTEAEKGASVVLTVTPYYKFELAELIVVDDNGNEITAFPNTDKTEYTYIQPECGVTVYGSFRSTETGENVVQTSVTGDGESSVEGEFSHYAQGDEVTITVSPADRDFNVFWSPYSLPIVSADVVGNSIKYKFVMPDCEVEFKFVFSDHIEGETTSTEYTNPFITKSAIDEIADRFTSFEYTPATVKYRGNPALQAGDTVLVEDAEGNEHIVPIMHQKFVFGGGMNGEISASAPSAVAKAVSEQERSRMSSLVEETIKTYEASRTVVTSDLSRGLSAVSSRVSGQGAEISSLTEWLGVTSRTLAEVKQIANENGASISLLVQDGEVQGNLVIQAINGESTAKISADRLDIEGKELNIKVNAVNIVGDLSVSRITGGTNNQPIIMTNFTAKDGGSIAGFSITSKGFEARTSSESEDIDVDVASAFRAGVSYRTELNVSTVRQYGNELSWFNKAYNVTGAQTIDISGLPGSNCEVFILEKLPTAADSVSVSGDTSKAIPTYYHDGSPGANTFITSDGFEGTAYLVINSSTNINPTVTITTKVYTGTFYLDNNGNITIPDKTGAHVYIGPKTNGVQIGAIDEEAVNVSSSGVRYSNAGDSKNVISFVGNDPEWYSTLHGVWYIDALGSPAEVTSDRTKKHDIQAQAEVYSRIFDRLLPVTFLYNNGTSGRTHLGLIAQDVEDAVLAEGLTTQEFAPLTYALDADGNKVNYGIRYDELISMCIYEIQKIKKTLEGN